MSSSATANTTTPFLVGCLLNFFLFGTLLAQVYIYRVCFSKDSWIIKSLVYFLFFAITFDSCLNASDVIFWFGTSFGDLAGFQDPRFDDFYVSVMGSFIAMLVHFFFCFRVFVMRRAVWPICILIALISIAQFVGGVGSGALVYLREHKTEVLKSHSFNADDVLSLQGRVEADLIYVWLIGGPVADVLIAITMATLILTADMQSSTRGIAKNIVNLIIETNALSAAVDLVTLFLFVGFPQKIYCSSTAMNISGIYANTLLATLNNRAIILRNRTNKTSRKVEMSAAASGVQTVSKSVETVGNVESVESMAYAEATEED
ncbi:hypothetical protein B0H12DRAFT_1244777 [Mycena haematopus]|nr:hypothetical protein B0H12DRAFT_1244777 [Mycena haematopus]